MFAICSWRWWMCRCDERFPAMIRATSNWLFIRGTTQVFVENFQQSAPNEVLQRNQNNHKAGHQSTMLVESKHHWIWSFSKLIPFLVSVFEHNRMSDAAKRFGFALHFASFVFQLSQPFTTLVETLPNEVGCSTWIPQNEMLTSLSLANSFVLEIPPADVLRSRSELSISLAVVFGGFPELASLKSSSRSNGEGMPPNKPFKNDCFGGSGNSLDPVNTVPTILANIWQKADDIVNLVSSDGEDMYIPWPFVLKNSVRAILNGGHKKWLLPPNHNIRQLTWHRLMAENLHRTLS